MKCQASLHTMKWYGQPAYPTQDFLDLHPELLRLAPRRWQGVSAVIGTLAAAALIQGASGCATRLPPDAPSRVAPLFAHGAGRGAWGGIASNPVVFLTEGEARKIVEEEAAQAGLRFALEATRLPNIETPVTSKYPATELTPPVTTKRTLTLDGTDDKRHVYYKYVSRDGFNAWEGREYWSTREIDDLRAAATSLQRGLAKAHPPGAYAVFYDPMAGDPYGNLWLDENALRARSRELLRLQVRDFLKWLKAQGVI